MSGKNDQNDDVIEQNDDLEPQELDDDDTLDSEEELDEPNDVDAAVEEAETFSKEYVAKLRNEAAQARVKGREAAAQAAEEAAERAREEFARDIYEALGLGDDEEVDPDDIIAEANRRAYEADEELRAYKVKDALSDAARENDANTKLLIPYLRGTGVLSDLDPEDDDFADQVSQAVASALDENPELKRAKPAAKRSGGDLSGGNGEKPKKSPNSIEDIIAARREHRKKRFGVVLDR